MLLQSRPGKEVMSGHLSIFFLNKKKGFDSCTTTSQQAHNNSSYEGGPQCVGPTFI
jgi:hypothetical protein